MLIVSGMSPAQIRRLIKTVARTALALTPLLPNERRRSLAMAGFGGAILGAAAGAVATSPELRRWLRDLVEPAKPAVATASPPHASATDHGAWVQDADD